MVARSIKQSKHRLLGVYAERNNVYAFYNLPREEGGFFRIETSDNALNFSLFHPICQIIDENGDRVDVRNTSGFHLSQTVDEFVVLAYKNGESLSVAKSENFGQFKKICDISEIKSEGIIVPNFQYQGKHVMYFGEDAIKLASSHTLLDWQIDESPVLDVQEDYFGKSTYKVAGAFLLPEGVLLLYYECKVINDSTLYFLHGVILDKENPRIIIKDVSNPLWEPLDFMNCEKFIPVGVVFFHDELVSYWETENGIIALVHPFVIEKILDRKIAPPIVLNRIKHNPIIKPILENKWESKATFNPAAVYDKDKVHIIYRAIGDNDVSVLGYATSFDGLNIDKRFDKPIYVPTKDFEGVRNEAKHGFHEGLYTSGGGIYGGCEDPRITKINDKFYMTYVAYDGNNPPRVALTSIEEGDFHEQIWNWSEPVLISPPNVVDKNACLLPEKVNGKYVVFHRIYPNILVDFVEDLDFDGKTNFLKGQYAIAPRDGFWDSRKVGVGAPPIKTDDGWLLIYQAVGEHDAGRYKIGAMMLDNHDPTKVLYRSKYPILEPILDYENEGHKAGVAYPCGAVNVGDKFIIYYGGADMVVCAAWEEKSKFLRHLKSNINGPFFESFNLLN